MTTVFCKPDELPNEKRDGKKGILFVDELNLANSQVQGALYGLILDRKLGNYTLPAGWVIVAAGNRQSDRSGVQKMGRALASRFAHVEVDPDAKTWIDNFALDNCDPMVTAFIRWRPNFIHYEQLVDNENITNMDDRMLPTPRSWERVSNILDAPDHMRLGLVTGLVGEQAATEFEGFIRTYRELPDIDDIIDDPENVEVPNAPDACYALSTALARYAERDNFKEVMIYAERLGREFEIITALDATKRDSMLTKTQAYIDFTKRNKDLQIGKFRNR